MALMKKEERLVLHGPYAQAYERVLTTIETLPWKVRRADEVNMVIEATTRFNPMSWGERVSIHFAPTDDGTVVTITSKVRLKTNIAAVRRNRKNVETLARRLRAQV